MIRRVAGGADRRVIGIIDYGAGNLRSVYNGLKAVGCECRATSDPAELGSFAALVVPGVGAFAQAMARLRALSLVDPLLGFIGSGKPVLGICLGLQILMEASDESDSGAKQDGSTGLGVLRGRVRRLPGGQKVPQIGWNSVRFLTRDDPLFTGLSSGAFFYFVHSYYVDPEDTAVVSCRCTYGADFAAGIRLGNVHAVQFHPEKSGRNGLTVLRNFGRLIER